MLGRRRHEDTGRGAGRGSSTGLFARDRPQSPTRIPAQGGPRDDGWDGFRLSEDPNAYPSTHPDHPGYKIFFSFKGGGEVTVATPEHPGVTSPLFWLVDLQVGEWTSLVDPDGRTIPVELRFQDGLASARWI